ncbi:DUF5131 family protein [Actinomadura kijaniata]|uniref:DUF5131 family protein n=1 Tax=Actinomadura kijaniata TaxID=46161 RepID=UPI000A05B36A
MADRSAIEWTEATWNPTTGCDRISSGCDPQWRAPISRAQPFSTVLPSDLTLLGMLGDSMPVDHCWTK